MCSCESTNLNMMNHKNTYYAVMMTISVPQTDNKERKSTEYVQNKDFAYVGAVIGGGFKNTKELNVIKYREVPVTNYTRTRIFMVLMLMDEWFAKILDTKGEFLYG